jgi:hypothetical protein
MCLYAQHRLWKSKSEAKSQSFQGRLWLAKFQTINLAKGFQQVAVCAGITDSYRRGNWTGTQTIRSCKTLAEHEYLKAEN